MSATVEDLGCFHAAFSADDGMVEMIPSFDFPGSIPLLSSTAVGPFKAGMVQSVPLWLAVYLKQRCLCSVVTPAWLTVENLVDIIAYEKREGGLWKDADRLPANYYEITKRFMSMGAADDANKALPVLIQDLFEVRLDKLRQKFQELFQEDSVESASADLLVSVDGIGTQELAVLRSFVRTALTDKNWLSSTSSTKKVSSSTAGAGEEEEEEATAAVDSPRKKINPTRTAIRSRVPLRRFR